MMNSQSLKPGAIAAVLNTDHVTEATRAALKTRLAWSPPAEPKCFGPEDFAVLTAVCERLVPQPHPDRQVALAARLDERLAGGVGDGWRYDALPPDRIAIAQGIMGIDQTARALLHNGFCDLSPTEQDQVLCAVQQGSPPGEVWKTLDAKRFFEDLLAQVCELYYSHPYAQERIGYIGMADAQGFHALGLNRRDPVENEAYDAPV